MSKMNIYKRKDGRLEGRLTIGKDPNGRQKYHAFYGYSREEVTKKMLDFTRVKMPVSKISIPFSAVFQEWYEKNQYKFKESTSANYRMKASKHILPFFGGRDISEILPNDIHDFIREKQLSGLSNRYISDNLTLLKAIFKYAVRQYHIINPMDDIDFKRSKSVEVSILDKEQKDRLKRYLLENPGRTSLGILLCMGTGLRIGELCALRWEDVDLQKRVLTVRHTVQRIQTQRADQKTMLIMTEPKSESSCRCIPLTDELAERMHPHVGKPQEFVLSGTESPVEPRVMQYRFTEILKNANLPSIHFHALRHMFASDCVSLGCDMKSLSELLGHSGIEITMNLYVHSSFEQKRQFLNRLNLFS